MKKNTDYTVISSDEGQKMEVKGWRWARKIENKVNGTILTVCNTEGELDLQC